MSARPEKKDVVATVTASIVAALETGVAPWVRPWTGSAGGALRLPENLSSGRAYRGVNVFILLAEGISRGYADHRWLTFNQARALGGSVRKGERGTAIVFWKRSVREVPAADGKTEERSSMFARTFHVFNVEQCDLPEISPAPVAPSGDAAEGLLLAAAERLGVSVAYGGERAYYSPESDGIRLPRPETFRSRPEYVATLAHELAHATGAKTRLDRAFGKRFGDDAYAVEELVAELAAAFICASIGVEGTLQHAEYIHHWVRVMKADKYAVFTAAAAATKAMEMIVPADSSAEEEGAESAEEAA